MKKFIKINLLLILVYILGYLLSKVGFPYLMNISGIVLFFMPGLFFSLSLEQFQKQRLGLVNLSLWTILFSFFVTTSVVYTAAYFTHNFGSSKIVLATFGALYIISIFTAILSNKVNGTEPTALNSKIFQKKPAFFYSIAIFLIVMIINLCLYRFVPEADPYFYLIKTREMITSGMMPQSEARPLFLVLSNLFVIITKIPAYWIYKLVFPLLGSIFVLLGYKISSERTENKYLITVSSLAFLTFPIIVLELLIARPQSIFFVTLPVFLYLIFLATKNRQKKKDSFLLLLLLFSLLGTKFHQFFLFDILITITAIIIFFWPAIKENLWKSTALLAGAAMVGYSSAKEIGIITQFKSFTDLFLNCVIHPRINLWYIDNYVSIDGMKMGWPGFTSLFYYGYNLGLLLLVVLIVALSLKKLNVGNIGKYWMYSLCFLFFFAVAEIFPRIGLAYLPDRAWLFVSVTLACLLSTWIPAVLRNANKKLAILIFASLVVSICLSFAVTYAKQGWTLPADYPAVGFIKNNTPTDAVFISQRTNFQIVQYFAERQLVLPSSHFFESQTSNKIELDKITNQHKILLENYNNGLRSAEEEIVNASNSFQSLEDKDISDDTLNLVSDIGQSAEDYLSLANKINQENKEKEQTEWYVLYSSNKFSSFYGSRPWWKESNFYNADLSIFNTASYQKVFDQNGVTIWKVIK